MSGLFNTLGTANKGLMAAQTALHTTAHNLSNANTEGYSRQRVDMKADMPYSLAGVGQLGTGVRMEAVVRIANDFVSKQIRQENGTLRQFMAKAEIMEQMEVIFNEPSDTSLNTDIGKMFDSWIELSNYPEMSTSKTIVVELSKTMIDTYNHMMSQISSLDSENKGMIDKNIEDFNAILKKLEELNKQIFNTSIKGHIPNDLMDHRDLMLKELSGFVDITPQFDKYERVNIDIDGQVLLDTEKGAKTLNYNGERIITIQGEDGLPVELNINSGELKGRLDAFQDIQNKKDELYKFGITLCGAINAVHGANGGIDIFEFDAADAVLSINQEIIKDPNKIKAGKADSAEGDGSIALLISKLRNTKLNFAEQPDFPDDFVDMDNMTLKNQTDGNTLGGYYNHMVTDIGISKEHAENMMINQDILLSRLELRRESESGVSIDEEVTNILKYQSAYAANARVITALSEMLDTLINRMGV